MNNFDDHYYIRKILEGDSRAFEEVVKQYSNMVYTICYRILKVREEAEEVAQDVFIKVFRSLDSFGGDSKLSTWIYKISYNAAISKWKSNLKFINNVSIENVVVCGSDQTSPLRGLQISEENEMIQRCIMKLPESERIIVSLYYYEELTVSEIAEIIGMSMSNVKVKLFRCRKKLFDELKTFFSLEKIESYG